ncbi:MAG: isoprenyl transferase [Epulopiscium sp.]|nr:isoprenyl transferase [Candidatus Epulonipiscium sp.]
MDRNINLPAHVGIIMDGNGRWAKSRSMPRDFGHKQGAKALEKISKYADEIGILHMSVYAFSTENWNRPKKEVDGLMNLLRNYLKRNIKDAKKDNIRVCVIGDRRGLPQDIQELIIRLEDTTKEKDGMQLNIALNYGGRDEIIRSIKEMAKDIENKKISTSDINEDLFINYLDTANIPDPDLIIRTSGEERLSNFLTWQSAYSEFYFTDCLWPDFDKAEFDKAIEVYQNRDRRFGQV